MRHLNANMCKEIECYMFNDHHNATLPPQAPPVPALDDNQRDEPDETERM